MKRHASAGQAASCFLLHQKWWHGLFPSGVVSILTKNGPRLCILMILVKPDSFTKRKTVEIFASHQLFSNPPSFWRRHHLRS